MALHFVTVGLRPNVPQSSAPALGGGFASGTGHGHCVSSRLACGQMFLKAAPRPLGVGVLRVRAGDTAFRHGWPSAKCSSKQRPRPLGAGALRVRATGVAFRHGWPSAKCSSKQRPGPWGRVCCECGPRALRFVTVGLWPNASQSSAPGPQHEDRQASFPQRMLPMLKIHERSECPCWHCPHGPKRRAR